VKKLVQMKKYLAVGPVAETSRELLMSVFDYCLVEAQELFEKRYTTCVKYLVSKYFQRNCNRHTKH
jgi:hypothetical protein